MRASVGLVAVGLLALAACADDLTSQREDGHFGGADSDRGDASTTSSSGATTSSSGGGASSGGSGASSGGAGTSSSGGSGGNGSAKPNCKYAAHATGLQEYTQVGGSPFHTYVPASYDPEVAHRVVFILHGQDSDGTGEMAALWQPIADAESLVLVAPKGSGAATDPASYPNGANFKTTDLNQIAELVGEIDECYNVDPHRHILWGFSEGGFYGYLLGLGAAELFSGLAMGGANTGFAQQNGFAPATAAWKIPVSHVHGTQDQNPIGYTRQDQTAFEAAGHVFTLHEHPGGHSISAEQVQMQWDDLKASASP